jgi:hypothetical protein
MLSEYLNHLLFFLSILPNLEFAIKSYARNHSLEVLVDEIQSAGWIRLAMAQQALLVMISPVVGF